MSRAAVLPSDAEPSLSAGDERRLQLTLAGGVVVVSALLLLTQLVNMASHGLVCVG
jgi:hypothetical protein